MWKTGLLAAAVGVAALVATVALGRPLVEPEATEETVVVARERSWADKASERCRDAVGSIRAELAGATGLTSTTERAVHLFGITTEIEGRLLRQLQALPPSDAQRTKIDQALDLLERQFRRDVATTARLERQFDYALLNREVLIYERLAARLRTLFGELGARGCVSYFDPESYR